MDDARLAHLCYLASIRASTLSPSEEARQDWIDHIRGASDIELFNEYTCLCIMAEAFVEMMNRSGMKPTFRVSAVKGEAK